MRRGHRSRCSPSRVAVWALGLLACDGSGAASDLQPEGPPQIIQVFAVERSVSIDPGTGQEMAQSASALAYGSHPDIERDPAVEPVTSAVAGPQQRLRVVIDELLRGNGLEEIACADGSYSRVPLGTDPDDIADCSGPPPLIADTCTAVCMGADGAIGIRDNNRDGAPDDLRLIADAVVLHCDEVPIELDRDSSFWQPSGNQQLPAGGADDEADAAIDALGPAIVVVPARGLRTSATCTLTLAEDITDKDGLRPCAPTPGAPCQPGDTAGIAFASEPLRVVTTSPRDGEDGVLPDGEGRVQILFNTGLAEDTGALGTVTVTADGVPVVGVRVAVASGDTDILTVELPGGLVPDTAYQVAVADTQDSFGGALPASVSFGFVTAEMGEGRAP